MGFNVGSKTDFVRSDVSFVVPRRSWANNTTYDMYEHDISASNPTTSGATNLYEGTFFFSTTENKVYKVLDNNGGTAYSGAEPTTTSTTLFELGGYTLQYMYSLTTSQIQKFLTTDFTLFSNRLNCICCRS